jgi:hypothetical protein
VLSGLLTCSNGVRFIVEDTRRIGKPKRQGYRDIEVFRGGASSLEPASAPERSGGVAGIAFGRKSTLFFFLSFGDAENQVS